MFLPWAIPVTVERDLWDWYLYAASLCAAITAILLFLPWAWERRRRPEVRIEWALSLDGDPAKLEDWPADYVPRIIPGQAIYVRVAVHNVGDRASEAALTNFIVPACFDLRRYTDLEANPAFLGTPPLVFRRTTGVAYFALGLEPWTPGNSFIYPYRLTYSTGSNQDQPLRTRLLFDVADSRFNRSGRRWLPSLLPPLELGHAHAGEPWPPRSRWPRPQRVHGQPRGRVACTRGNRRDVRDLIVLPASQALAPQKDPRRLLDHPGLACLVDRAAHALPRKWRAARLRSRESHNP